MRKTTLESLSQCVGCLKELAFDPAQSLGRRDPIDDESWLAGLIDNPIPIDLKKVDESKMVRRLAGKTQVWTLPGNPHIRNRDIHSREGIPFISLAARLLGLNDDFCRLFMIFHDTGHVPGGHPGEKILTRLSGKPVKHNRLACVISQMIERQGRGLNLLFETYEGVLFHSGDTHIRPIEMLPLEYQLLAIIDTADFLIADVEDAIKRMKAVSPADLPQAFWQMGETQRQRQQYLLCRLLKESYAKGTVSLTDEAFLVIKEWMYEYVYYPANSVEFAEDLEITYGAVATSPLFEGCQPELVIALMIDSEVHQIAQTARAGRTISPDDLERMGVSELLPHIRGRQFDLFNPGLDWGLARTTCR